MEKRARRPSLCIFVIATTVVIGIRPASAFQRGIGFQPEMSQAAGATISMTDFSARAPGCGGGNPEDGCEFVQDFSFDQPVLGLFYSRPGIQLFVGRGVQDGPGTEIGDLELLELTINIFGAIRPSRKEGAGAFALVFPYGLHSGYRRIRAQDQTSSIDQFEATVMAAGLGVGVVHGGEGVRIEARAVPFFGLASQSLGFGTGTSSMLDADLEATIGPIIRRVGIHLGYRFRWQKWNLGKDFGSKQDFTGRQHGFRIGVSW